jgi:hypothetical protein
MDKMDKNLIMNMAAHNAPGFIVLALAGSHPGTGGWRPAR